jgi:hypothetical protein
MKAVLTLLILAAPVASFSANSKSTHRAASPVAAFSANGKSTHRRVAPLKAVNGVWNTGNDFGKGKFRFYEGMNLHLVCSLYPI